LAEIDFEHATKVYDDGTLAVSGLDLVVDDGSLMVLVGPSGCGKTTALRMVAGLEEITDGTIRIDGRVVNEVAPKDRDIAMVFQNYALYPHMNVFENMAFGLRLRKFPKKEIDERVHHGSGILGLDDFLTRKPKALSGGQRQRVAMGRAIVREPRAYLMDEPLSNLDAKLRVQMRSEISRLQRDLNVTTIYVTHDQTEAMTMGDRVAVLKTGLLQQVDTPRALYDHPANLFVAGFVGSPAMNLVHASVEHEDGRLAVRFGGNRVSLQDDLLAARPGLRSYEGKPVILGIRPEALEDASIVSGAQADRRFPVTVDLREDMGPELYIHFAIDAEPVVTDDIKQIVSDDEVALRELEARAAQRTTPFIARFSGRSTVQEGQHSEVWVDTRALHFFDPETGEGIYGG